MLVLDNALLLSLPQSKGQATTLSAITPVRGQPPYNAPMDAHTYLLAGLLSRHFALGRIVRFRSVTRGRQATCYEVFTAEEREFLVHLYPPAFPADALERMAKAVNAIDAERFSVVPFQSANDGHYVVAGPQHSRMMVGLNPVGTYLLPDQYTDHDLSQLGLRLAWLHRLLFEQLGSPLEDSLSRQLLAVSPEAQTKWALADAPTLLAELEDSLEATPAPAWAHGDLQPAAVLVDDDHQLRTVVDFALLTPADPLEDLVDVALHWCMAGDSLNGDRARSVFEAYRSLRSIDPERWGGAMDRYLARRLVAAAFATRPLPRNLSLLINQRSGLAKCLVEFSD